MKKTFRILLSTTLLGVLGLVSVPSQALVKWNFVNANCISANNTPGCDNDARTYDAFLTTAGETAGTVTATGWANTEPGGSNNTLATGEVHDFGSSGIGVVNGDNAFECDVSGCNGGAEHAVDNIDRYDLVLFNFQDDVSVNEVGIGFFESDADISLLAYVGAGTADIAGVGYSGTSESLTGSGWELIGNFDVDTVDTDQDQGSGTDYVQAVNTNVSSSQWIVAAYNPVFAVGPNEAQNCCNAYNDKIKILSLAGTIDVPSTPGSSLPLPGSLALLLGGIVPILRRRRLAA